MKTYKVVFVLLAATVLLLGTVSIATAGATSQRIPFAFLVYVECALDGEGEYVELTGTLHIVDHVVIDKNDGFHISTHSQPQGVSGEGLDSGDMYRAVGVTRQNQNISGAGLPKDKTLLFQLG